MSDNRYIQCYNSKNNVSLLPAGRYLFSEVNSNRYLPRDSKGNRSMFSIIITRNVSTLK